MLARLQGRLIAERTFPAAVQAIYRHIEGNGIVHVEVYDANENKVAWASGFQEGHSLSIRADKKLIYYVKVQADNVDTENYELAVRNKST
jgi:hypothetical protein